MYKIVGILVFLCLLVTACGGSTECSSSGYNEITGIFLEQWEAVQTYIKTLRFTDELTGQISELENILAEYKNLDVPDCYHPAHDKFVSGMEYGLAGVRLLGAGGDVADNFDLANAEFAAAREELLKLDE